MQEFEIIKKLEYLIAFQSECLSKNDFAGFDKAENDIRKIEKALVDNKREIIEETEKIL